MGAEQLPLAGVEAIVQGLSQFQGDIGKMNSSLDMLRPRATLLQQAFSGAWEMVKGFGEEVLRVAEYALGKLLADAIEWVVQKIGELIRATIEAGSEFQTLELRLNGINFDTLLKSGMDYNKATEESIKLTKEQLAWLQKLAATTPYDNTDISNVYTLARSYGFADAAARQLTENTGNFAAAMGLSGDALERVIINFGQMVARGKITSTEMRDLARGTFMPINDILERIGKKIGMTTAQVSKAISKPGGGLPAQLFIDAFNEMIAEEPRFVGAAERMAKTFKAASDNAMDIVKSIGGLQIVKPILDAIGARIAAFTSSFTDNPERWDKLVAAAKRVGDELAKIVDGLLGLLPSSESIADATVRAVQGIADWLDLHGPGIVQFFKDLGKIVGGVADRIRIALSLGQKPTQETKKPGQPTGAMGNVYNDRVLNEDLGKPAFGQGFLDVVTKIADFINNTLIPAFLKIQVWFEVNKPLIDEFWKTVWDIIGQVISDIFGGPQKEGGTSVLTLITDFMKFVIDNKEEIVKWVEVLWSLFAVWQVIGTVLNILIPIVLALVGAFGTLAFICSVLGLAFAPVVVAILAIIAVAVLAYLAWKTNFLGIQQISASVLGWIISTIQNVILWLDNLGRQTSIALQKAIVAIQGIDWQKFGVWIMQGLANGIKIGTSVLVGNLVSAAMTAYNAAKNALGMHSPSKLFEEIGVGTMEGFAQGIQKAAGLAVGAMQGAVAAVAVPAVSSAAGAGDTYNSRTANLTIHTSAPREPIIQDFAMMESMMGA